MVKDYIVTQFNNIKNRAKNLELNEKLDEIKELLAEKGLYHKPQVEEKKKVNPCVIVFAVIGAIAAVAAIAYAVFYFFTPEDSEYYEGFDEDEDEFEDSDLEDD